MVGCRASVRLPESLFKPRVSSSVLRPGNHNPSKACERRNHATKHFRAEVLGMEAESLRLAVVVLIGAETGHVETLAGQKALHADRTAAGFSR